LFDRRGPQAGRLRFEPAARSAAQADYDVNSAVVKVQRLRPALIAIPKDRHALAGERRRIDVGVFQKFHNTVRAEPVEALSFF
jgi:hypothetical protein